MFENAEKHKILSPKMITYSLHSICFNLSGFNFDIFIGEGPKHRQVIIIQIKQFCKQLTNRFDLSFFKRS
jgi:hypothetical protein